MKFNFILPIKTIVLFLFLISLSGCASKKNVIYFQDEENTEEFEALYNKYTPKLQPDDLLVITISAMDVNSTLPFNLTTSYNELANNESRRITYLIDEEGYIDYPVLGKIKLGGLTRSEATEYLKSRLKEYIVDPGVNIYINNFRITVLGEVAKPGTFTLQNEKITILEALGLAGDLTINGQRKNILVVREIDGKKTFNRIDLTKKEVFNSPVFYLAQNDVVYVEPNFAQVQSSTYSRSTSVIISVTSLLITVISILTR